VTRRLVLAAAAMALVAAARVVPTAAASALTATDYVEIQQLVARASYTLDTAADQGRSFAAVFTRDGRLTSKTARPYDVRGPEQLAAFAMGDLAHRGPAYVRDYVTNHIIQPSPEGASGRVYVVWIEVEENGRPGAMQGGGRYEDTYVKTPAGWRIRTRMFVPSKLGPRP